MTDISQFTAPKSDQLNSDDLVDKTLTIKITKVTGTPGDQPVSIFFEGDGGKPYKPCKSMLRVLQRVWGSDGASFKGRSLTLYRDPAVKFGGLEVGGIRISHMSHIDKPVTLALTASKANKKPFTVKPLKVAEAEVPPIPDALREAGYVAASGGVDAYTTWKDGLSAEDKALIKPLHANWSKIAKAADEAKDEGLEEEEVPV